MTWQDDIERLIEEAQESDIYEREELLMEAGSRIPADEQRSFHAMWLSTELGETYLARDDHDRALEAFSYAVACEGGLGSPYVHFRLGQLRYDRGEIDRARDELIRAYMGSGRSIFDLGDSKYFECIRDLVEKAPNDS